MYRPDHTLFLAELDACMSDNEHGCFAETTYDRHTKMALQDAMIPMVLSEATSKHFVSESNSPSI